MDVVVVFLVVVVAAAVVFLVGVVVVVLSVAAASAFAGRRPRMQGKFWGGTRKGHGGKGQEGQGSHTRPLPEGAPMQEA